MSIEYKFLSLIKNRRFQISIGACVLIIVLTLHPMLIHFKAVTLLLKISGQSVVNIPSFLGNLPVEETVLTFHTPSKTIQARLYMPYGVSNFPGMVIIHGVHHLGIEEPRLKLFSRAIAATGITILTPEVTELADYNIKFDAVETIGNSTKFLYSKLGNKQVGLMGLSFSGGLALLTAVEPQYKTYVGYVCAIGAHHNLQRVSQFFATNQAQFPDGHAQYLQAHPYGPLVIVYSHLNTFFPEQDLPIARDTLKLWLWEQHDKARQRTKELSNGSQAKMQILLDQKIDQITPEIFDCINSYKTEMDKVSPSGHLAELDVPVFLLHGSEDTVIPASETLWLEKELPPNIERHVLITSLISHVELSKNPSWVDKWQLIHLLSQVLYKAG